MAWYMQRRPHVREPSLKPIHVLISDFINVVSITYSAQSEIRCQCSVTTHIQLRKSREKGDALKSTRTKKETLLKTPEDVHSVEKKINEL
jgi:hypothetical protein